MLQSKYIFESWMMDPLLIIDIDWHSRKGPQFLHIQIDFVL